MLCSVYYSHTCIIEFATPNILTLTPTHTRRIPSIVLIASLDEIWDDVSVSAFKSPAYAGHFYSIFAARGLICIFTISLAFFGVISYCWHTSESQFNSEHNSNDCLLAVTGETKQQQQQQQQRNKKNCSLHTISRSMYVLRFIHVLCGEIITLAVSFQF